MSELPVQMFLPYNSITLGSIIDFYCVSCTAIQTLNHSPDYFVLCGGAYLEMREALTQSIVDESVDHFQQHIQVQVHHVYIAILKLFYCFDCCVGASCFSSPSATNGAVQ